MKTGYEDMLKNVAAVAKTLEELKDRFRPEQFQQAQEALAKGDTEAADALLKNAPALDDDEAAEVAYQRGKLAETRIDFAVARQQFNRAVQLKPDNPLYLDSAGSILSTLGAYGEAAPLYKRALRIREKSLGPEHPDTAAGLNNLAVLYRHQGRYDEAEPLYVRAVAILEKALGPEHPNTAQSLSNLAELYRRQARYDKAEPLFERALESTEKALGPEHNKTAQILNNLAGLYKSQGRYSEAETFYQRVVPDVDDVHVPHPNDHDRCQCREEDQ